MHVYLLSISSVCFLFTFSSLFTGPIARELARSAMGVFRTYFGLAVSSIRLFSPCCAYILNVIGCSEPLSPLRTVYPHLSSTSRSTATYKVRSQTRRPQPAKRNPRKREGQSIDLIAQPENVMVFLNTRRSRRARPFLATLSQREHESTRRGRTALAPKF